MNLGVWVIVRIQKRQIPYQGSKPGERCPHLPLEFKDGEVLCVKVVTEPDTVALPIPSRHLFSC